MKLTLEVHTPEEFATLDELEAFVQDVGQRLKRQVFETLASAVKPIPMTCPHCGHQKLERRGQRPRQLKTLFGSVKLANPRFCCTECHSYCAQLDILKGQLISTALREVAIHCGMSWPYAAAARMIRKLTGVHICPKEIQLLCEAQGHQLATDQRKQAVQNTMVQQEHLVQRIDQLLQGSVPPSVGEGRLYVQLDGVHIHSCQQQQSLEGKVAAVFTDACEARGKRKTLLDRDYVVTFAGNETLGKLAYVRALSKGLRHREVIVIGDGAPWIGRLQRKYFTHAKFVLDWWHLKERVWKQLALAIADPYQRQQLGRCWVQQLWTGKVNAVLKSIHQQPGHPLRKLEQFLRQNRRAVIDYQSHRQQGYYISSSLVEKAADLVVGRRQKHQGMSWTRQGAQAVAVLRTVFLNGN